MDLEHREASVDVRSRTLHRVRRRDYLGNDARICQSHLEQSVEIGGDNHLDVARARERRDRSVRGRCDLQSLLALICSGLEVLSKQCLTFRRRGRQPV
jgi:hypothetical protein